MIDKIVIYPRATTEDFFLSISAFLWARKKVVFCVFVIHRQTGLFFTWITQPCDLRPGHMSKRLELVFIFLFIFFSKLAGGISNIRRRWCWITILHNPRQISTTIMLRVAWSHVNWLYIGGWRSNGSEMFWNISIISLQDVVRTILWNCHSV